MLNVHGFTLYTLHKKNGNTQVLKTLFKSVKSISIVRIYIRYISAILPMPYQG